MEPNVPQPPPERVTRVFSFGYGHVCPYTGEKLIDHHATITAPTPALCRDLMVAVFGRAWAFEYTSLEAATRGGQFPSAEHIRIELPGDAADPDHGRTTAVAEAEPDTLVQPLGRAAEGGQS